VALDAEGYVLTGADVAPGVRGTATSVPGVFACGDLVDHTYFLALLAKQRGVRPDGWEQVAGVYAEESARRSVADVTGPESLQEVRAFKKAEKAAAKQAKG